MKTYIDAAVNSRQAGNEDEAVDEMDTTLPAGILDGDGHRRTESTGLAVDKSIGVRWAGESKEDGGAHIDLTSVSRCVLDK